MTWIFLGWMFSRFFVFDLDPTVPYAGETNWTMEGGRGQLRTTIEGGSGQPPTTLEGGSGQPPTALEGGSGQPPTLR